MSLLQDEAFSREVFDYELDARASLKNVPDMAK